MIKMTLKDLNAIVERTFTGRRFEPTGLLDTMRRTRGRRGLGITGGIGTRPIISFQPKAPEMPEALGAPKQPRPPRKYPFLRG